ncbi:hypothetical protein ACN26Y_24575 [Micromonospora sp. WMMD558]|nr:hypothetical protein [Micromonospora sp. WMMC415]
MAAVRLVRPDLAEAYGTRNAVPGELLVRLTVEKVVGYTGISD